MLRRLDFTPDAPAYEKLQRAAVINNAQWPIGELVVLADVQRKLAEIGSPKPAGEQPEGGIAILRSCAGGSVVLEESEYNALVKAFDNAGWLSFVAMEVAPIKKMLMGLPEWKPPTEAPV